MGPGTCREGDLPALPHHIVAMGDYWVTDSAMLVSTVLGSCIAVCFWDPDTRFAGMIHALLPIMRDHRGMETTRAKFVDSGIGLLEERFRARRIDPRRVEIKLFGGANALLPEETMVIQNLVKVGEANVDQALIELKKRGLRIRSQDVLGRKGRQVVMDTTTGVVWRRYLTPGARAR